MARNALSLDNQEVQDGRCAGGRQLDHENRDEETDGIRKTNKNEKPARDERVAQKIIATMS